MKYVAIVNLILEAKIYALWTNLRTRSKTNLWLIGPTSENILGAGLPTNEAVLKYFFSSQRQGIYNHG